MNFFGHPEDELYTVAITGTKGKTTTTAMVAEIFEHAGIKTGTIGTLGVVYGGETHKTDNTTPESYIIQKSMRDMINAGCKAMVIEASSIGLKHSRLAGMTFDVGIFTNFSDDHIGGVEHKDLAEYLYCKSLLFRQCKFAAANIDDPAWKDITKDFKGSVLTYGFADNADLKGKMLIFYPKTDLSVFTLKQRESKIFLLMLTFRANSMHTTHLRQFRQFHSLTKLKIR